jgi:hypothetical protein
MKLDVIRSNASEIVLEGDAEACALEAADDVPTVDPNVVPLAEQPAPLGWSGR